MLFRIFVIKFKCVVHRTKIKSATHLRLLKTTNIDKKVQIFFAAQCDKYSCDFLTSGTFKMLIFFADPKKRDFSSRNRGI